MDLIALAVPFFLLALLIELAVDRWRGSGHYRGNDAINSLSAGTLSTTFGYFTKLLPVIVWGSVLQHLALFELDPGLFDLSPAGLLNWFLALLAFDFLYYWKHRFGHEMSLFWAAHAVHHQSEDYNLSTALRQTSTDFLFGWIFYVPLFLAGLPLEVVATVNALDLIYQFWVHTQHINKLGWLDRVFVTPSNHRVHHAQNAPYIDKNYGGILILWDRLFGTFQEELDSEPVVFGVRKPLASWNPFRANLQVYEYLWFDARRTARWRDKLGIWFRRTGWRPADVARDYPKPASDLARFKKFDPDIGSGMRRYVLLQFIGAALSVLWIGQLYADEGPSAVILPCMLLWAGLYSIGCLNEGSSHALAIERLRLLVATPVILFGMTLTGTASPVTLAIAGTLYVSVSLLGLQLTQTATPTPGHAA